MFQSFEAKHPKFYQVFRLLLLHLHQYYMRGICAVLLRPQDFSLEDFQDFPCFYRNNH